MRIFADLHNNEMSFIDVNPIPTQPLIRWNMNDDWTFEFTRNEEDLKRVMWGSS